MIQKEIMCKKPVKGSERNNSKYTTECKVNTPFGIQCCTHSFNAVNGELIHVDPTTKKETKLSCTQTTVGRFVQKCSEKYDPLPPGFRPTLDTSTMDTLTCPKFDPRLKYPTVCRPDTKGGLGCCVAKSDLTIVKPVAATAFTPLIPGRVFYKYQNEDETFTELTKCYFDKSNPRGSVLQCFANAL